MRALRGRVPEPNDGLCPYCGHQSEPRFGAFRCPECGKVVSDDDMSRRIRMMSGKQWLLAVLGGLGLGACVVMLGLATRGN